MGDTPQPEGPGHLFYISQGLSHLIGLPVSHCNGEEVQVCTPAI